jgi:DNA-binding NtrC family response regulator
MRSEKRVLVVQSDLVTAKALVELIASWGFPVRLAEDGKRALELILNYDPHILVIDLRLPKIDGLALLGTLAERKIPISTIVIADETEVSDVVQAIKLGAYDYQYRPIDRPHLRVVLNNLSIHLTVIEENRHLREQLVQAGALGSRVGIADVSVELKRGGGDAFEIKLGMSLDEVERELITRTIEFSGGNKSRAAEILGVSLKTLYNRLDRYQVRSSQHSA